MSWNNGYVTEIDYTHGYYCELCPQIIDLALLWSRESSPVKRGMRYLELGYGQGVSLNIHAASNDGEFWGTDFNPSQAANAKELAKSSGANLKVLDNSFAEFAKRSDLPEFDVITVHGIWTWISDENRKTIIEIIRTKLAVGGVVYLSYNCTQGWSNSMPLRQLMFLHSQLMTGKAEGIVTKINGAIRFAERLISADALHFKNNPLAVERVQYLKDRPRQYLAHELFNADWQPMLFSEVASYIEEGKVTYVGSGKLLDHFEAINLTSQHQAVLKEITDKVFKETVRDFCMDRTFRSDLYVKGARPVPTEMQINKLRAKRFVLTMPAQDVLLTVNGGLGEANLKVEIYQPLIAALASGDYAPKTVLELEQLLDPKVFTVFTILESLVLLTAAGRAAVAHEDEVTKFVEPRTRALNQNLINRAKYNEECTTLASPVCGCGVVASRISMLFIRAINTGENDPKQWIKTIWDILTNQGQRMLKNGKPLEKTEDNIEELNRLAKEFNEKLLPVFRAHKIV